MNTAASPVTPIAPGVRPRLSIALHAVSVRRGRLWALRDVSLELQAGERWALLGANGSGKTQLLKLIAGQVWPTPTGREQIIYRLGGRGIDAAEAKARIAYLGGESQDKYARHGWNPTVRDLLATGTHDTDLLLAPVTAHQARVVASTLKRCGLGTLGARRFASLSYGQKRIALLARALCRQPDWLLLDEFYNGLDVHYRARIDRLLARARTAGCAWIAAAHRAPDVPRGTRMSIEIDAGRLAAVRALRPARLERLARAAGEPRAARRQPSRPTPPSAAASTAAGTRIRRDAPLIRLRHVNLYVDYRRVLRDVDWELGRGEHWAIVGANGAGKTSFLKLLYGDLSPALGGRIERDGCPPGTPIGDWKRRIGYVSPELQTDHGVNVTVRDLVVSGRHASIGLADAASGADARMGNRWLKFFGLTTFAGRRPRELSYGQLRRALIARALAAEPRLLLLDEPLTGLDPTQRALMKALLQRLMVGGITLVVAVHHAEDLPAGITRVLRLAGGRVHAESCDFAN